MCMNFLNFEIDLINYLQFDAKKKLKKNFTSLLLKVV